MLCGQIFDILVLLLDCVYMLLASVSPFCTSTLFILAESFCVAVTPSSFRMFVVTDSFLDCALINVFIPRATRRSFSIIHILSVTLQSACHC